MHKIKFIRIGLYYKEIDNIMKEKKLNSVKYNEICEQLPECIHNFLYTGLAEKSALTRINYALDIQNFLSFAISFFPYFPEKKTKELEINDLRQITTNNINEYLAYMKEKDIADNTRARRKSAISMMFKYLTDTEKKLQINPVSGAVKVKLPQKDYVIYLNEDEQNILINGIRTGFGLSDKALQYHKDYAKRDLAIVFLFLDMGLRISELHGIDLQDVDFDDCSVIINRKGNKYSKLWFSDQSLTYITDYIEERKCHGDICSGDEPLFITKDGSRLSIRAIQAMLEKYIKACLPNRTNISVHKLRSSFAMTYYRTNPNLLMLQKRLGHANINTSQIYAKATEQELMEDRNWKK